MRHLHCPGLNGETEAGSREERASQGGNWLTSLQILLSSDLELEDKSLGVIVVFGSNSSPFQSWLL